MTHQQVEARILEVLGDETTAVGLSDRLFTADGLFSLLASNEDERRAMVRTPLFKQAQKRFRELQFKEAEQFGHAVANIQGANLSTQRREKSEQLNTK